MKLLPAALAGTFAIALTASVFAVWPAVGDAPWEEDPADRTAALRCEGALALRVSVIEAGEYSAGSSPGARGFADRGPGNPDGLRDYDQQLSKAEREIDRYC